MRRAAALAVALVAIACAYFVVPPERTPGPPLRDFEAYYAAGTTWHYSGDPYSRDVWRTEKDVPGVLATRDELLPFVGPPFGLPLWDTLARLPFGWAVVMWGSVVVLAAAVLAWCSLRLAETRPSWVAVLGVFAFAACFGPLTSGVALGQVAIVSCAAIAAVPFLVGPRATLLAAGGALVAALQPNLAIVLVARLASMRTWIAFACAAALAVGGSALALGGAHGLGRYLEVLRAHGAAERFIAIQTTPGAIARSFGASSQVAATIGLFFALAVTLALTWQFFSGRFRPDDRLALASAALPVGLVFGHEHDLAIAFMPAIVVLARARGVAWVVAAFATLTIGVDWLGLAQRPTGIASTVLLALGAAAALTTFVRTLRPYHLLPLLMPIAVAIAGVYAMQHRLPTWPDALPLGYHAPVTLPAAALWYDEQRLSGLTALDPAWSVLRSLSLAGSAALWAVATFALAAPASTTPRHSSASTRAVRTEFDVGLHVDAAVGDR